MSENTITLALTPEALSLLSTILDFHDDDTELAEESGESLETVDELRTAVAEAIRQH